MRIKYALALASFCLIGLWGHASAAEPTGAAFCVTCHDDEDLPDMSKSAHGFKAKDGSPDVKAPVVPSRNLRGMGFRADVRIPDCISCHGPSEAHAKKPEAEPRAEISFGKNYGKVTKTSAADRDRACQTCHDRDSRRALWDGSQHQSADVACDSCHRVHTNKDKVLDKATQTPFCESCHKAQRAEMSRASHHPVPEGKMACSDCHNVHGSAGPKLVSRDSTNATCFTCHAEKRGPFVQQHEPVAEDCSSCHNPHGSNIAGMLTARAPMLCQQCHTPHVLGSVGALGGQGVSLATSISPGQNAINNWQGRSCMNCHTQVHGSNNPSSQLLMR